MENKMFVVCQNGYPNYIYAGSATEDELKALCHRKTEESKKDSLREKGIISHWTLREIPVINSLDQIGKSK